MVTSPDAIYQILSKDLDYTLSRTVTHDAESIPLYVKKFSAALLKEKFLSKLIPKDSTATDFVAYRTFHASNEACRVWQLPTLSSTDEQLVGEFAKILEDFFLVDLGKDCELTWANIAMNARCGPGAAVGASSNSAYSKLYSGPLTAADPEIVTLYRADINLWPEESNAELIRQENYGSPVIVKGSRSSFVPKTTKTSRMISVEPTLNMFYQLGLGEIITKRLKRFFGIDLETQASVNRYLAHVGSMVDASWGDGFATIDLSSASDSISLGLCAQFVPEEWFSTLLSLRSHETQVRLGKEVFDQKLHMMSTMGNGFTFPLQTAIFASIAAACVSCSDDIRQKPRGFGFHRPGMFSVFGDDIIVPSRIFERTCRLLTLLGFNPNPEKSFGSGPFRESCGHDYYHGYNVRPVFLRKLDTSADLMVITNLLVDWSARNQIPIDDTIRYLISLQQINLVPMSESMDAGLRVPYSIAVDYVRLTNGFDHNKSLIYTKRQTQPRRMRLSEGDIHVPRGVKPHIYNPSGLLMSYLRGEVRHGAIHLSTYHPVYGTKKVVAPNWDYFPPTLEAPMIGTAESPAVLTKRFDMILRYPLKDAVGLSRRKARRKS